MKTLESIWSMKIYEVETNSITMNLTPEEEEGVSCQQYNHTKLELDPDPLTTIFLTFD